MAKNTRSKAKKIRSYKVHNDGDIPYIIVKGKFLEDLGMGGGTRFEMVVTNDGLNFRKMTNAEILRTQFPKAKRIFRRHFNLCEQHLEQYAPHDPIYYSKHLSLLRSLQACGEAITTLYASLPNETEKAKIMDTIIEYKKHLNQFELVLECEAFKTQKFDLVNLGESQFEIHKRMLKQLLDCGRHFGIFKQRKLFAFKMQRYAKRKLDSDYNCNPTSTTTVTQRSKPIMAVAEAHDATYSVDDEIARNPKRYLQA